MCSEKKSLILGTLVGFLVALLIFAGGIQIWIQLSSQELIVPANQLTTISVGGMTFNFIYDPNAHKLTVNGSDRPFNVGFVSGWSWGRYKIIQVTPDFLVLFFKPWRFTSIQDVIGR